MKKLIFTCAVAIGAIVAVNCFATPESVQANESVPKFKLTTGCSQGGSCPSSSKCEYWFEPDGCSKFRVCTCFTYW
jgi:hypothetical protein